MTTTELQMRITELELETEQLQSEIEELNAYIEELEEDADIMEFHSHEKVYLDELIWAMKVDGVWNDRMEQFIEDFTKWNA